MHRLIRDVLAIFKHLKDGTVLRLQVTDIKAQTYVPSAFGLELDWRFNLQFFALVYRYLYTNCAVAL